MAMRRSREKKRKSVEQTTKTFVPDNEFDSADVEKTSATREENNRFGMAAKRGKNARGHSARSFYLCCKHIFFLAFAIACCFRAARLSLRALHLQKVFRSLFSDLRTPDPLRGHPPSARAELTPRLLFRRLDDLPARARNLALLFVSFRAKWGSL
jgi:hypothetical protein